VAMVEARRVFGELPRVRYAGSPMEAARDADALIVVTEWKEFRSPDFEGLRGTLRQPLIFDGRNLYDPELVRAAGLEHFGIGRR
jgi:UDPglucose 6-dehydrogenase